MDKKRNNKSEKIYRIDERSYYDYEIEGYVKEQRIFKEHGIEYSKDVYDGTTFYTNVDFESYPYYAEEYQRRCKLAEMSSEERLKRIHEEKLKNARKYDSDYYYLDEYLISNNIDERPLKIQKEQLIKKYEKDNSELQYIIRRNESDPLERYTDGKDKYYKARYCLYCDLKLIGFFVEKNESKIDKNDLIDLKRILSESDNLEIINLYIKNEKPSEKQLAKIREKKLMKIHKLQDEYYSLDEYLINNDIDGESLDIQKEQLIKKYEKDNSELQYIIRRNESDPLERYTDGKDKYYKARYCLYCDLNLIGLFIKKYKSKIDINDLKKIMNDNLEIIELYIKEEEKLKKARKYDSDYYYLDEFLIRYNIDERPLEIQKRRLKKKYEEDNSKLQYLQYLVRSDPSGGYKDDIDKFYKARYCLCCDLNLIGLFIKKYKSKIDINDLKKIMNDNLEIIELYNESEKEEKMKKKLL